MHLFTTFFILATFVAAPIWAAEPVADEVYRCDFGVEADRDYDAWPDGWTRRRGRDWPDFVRIGIVARPPAAAVAKVGSGATANGPSVEPAAADCLAIQLDGGAAELSSPPINVDSSYSLILQARIRTDQLKHDAAHITLALLDETGRQLESHDSPLVRGSSDWTTVQVGPVAVHGQAKTAVISLALLPPADREDLTGTAWFSELRLLRVPRMSLHTTQPGGVYHEAAGAEVVCEVSGIAGVDPQVTFELYDHVDALLASHTAKISGPPLKPKGAGAVEAPKSISGAARWNPPLPGYGFYRVRVRMPLIDNALLERAATIAVLRPMAPTSSGEFGWSLPGGEHPLPLDQLAELLGDAGIHWAKFPVWHRQPDDAWTDRLAWFAEHLSLKGVEMVGLLDHPPRPKGDLSPRVQAPIAALFAEQSDWNDAVDPIMTRLSLKVRWWQLGADDDTSFVGLPNIDARIADVKQQFDRFGQDIRLGIPWRWTSRPPSGAHAPWEFLAMTSDPPLTADELARYLQDGAKPPLAQPVKGRTLRNHFGVSTSPLPGTTSSLLKDKEPAEADQKWVTLPLISRQHFSPTARVQDLVQRMVAAKVHGAKGVFVPQPFSDDHGLMQSDGTPGDLFVPWRTVAAALSGSNYVGQIELPEGSTNFVFGRNGQAVMVLWNATQVRERLSLGSEVQQIDLWGRNLPCESAEVEGMTECSIEVGPTPTLVVGLHEAIARCQVQVNFENPRLASVFGREQPLVLRLPNSFSQAIGGELTLRTPKALSVNPRVVHFKVAPGEELRQTLPVQLDVDASSGPQPVVIDFDIAADKPYRFRVHRTLQLGLEGLTVEMNTRLIGGSLVVEQRMTNHTDRPISFRCTLFSPGRRRETKQILEQGRDQSTLVFTFPEGEQLIGQTLRMRAEEIGGDRVLNQTVIAER